MPPRPQVHDAHVAFAHAEHVAPDDLVERDLVEFGLGDRLHAHGLARNQSRERLAAFLNLAVVVRFDRAEVERTLHLLLIVVRCERSRGVRR